jgi:hypothetical protein
MWARQVNCNREARCVRDRTTLPPVSCEELVRTYIFSAPTHVLELPVSTNSVSDESVPSELSSDQTNAELTLSRRAANAHRRRIRDNCVGHGNRIICLFSVLLRQEVFEQG